MSGSAIADKIAPELPYLRRFARALSGSQENGDAFVVQTLEAIIADNRVFRNDLQPKIAIFNSFLRIWNSMPLNGFVEQPADALHAQVTRKLERITPLPRQAFLLNALEEFSSADVARVLDRTEAEAEALIAEAGQEISAQIASRIMIIEDEPLIALDIEMLVQELGHSSVGIATTKDEAVSLASKQKPDLILSDIQLADGSSGIRAIGEIVKSRPVPVIFITAYPELLLTGERAEPVYLITKPFQPSMVKAVISQALFFDVPARAQAIA